jgi:predicted kinase
VSYPGPRPGITGALPLLVIVTGPPGAGKTSVASALQATLGLPLIAKDALKEVLGGALGVTERAASHHLGSAVFELMGLVLAELLDAGISVIAEGNFAPARTRIFGGLPAARVVQVHVDAPPAVLRERLRARDTHRHPVHYDFEAADEIAARARAGEWAPLRPEGELVRIHTDPWPDLSAALAGVSA